MRIAGEVFSRQVYEDIVVTDTTIVVPLDEIGYAKQVTRSDAHAALLENLAFYPLAYALAEI
jgi:hypothetical protein